MQLKIVGDCLAKVKVDMAAFRRDYKKTLDLRESILENFSVLEHKEELAEDWLFRAVYQLLDWGRILTLLNEIDKEFMEVRFYSCEFRDRIEMFPGEVSEDGRQFRFRQERRSGKDMILINSFMSSPDYDMASYLKSSYFNYGFKKWKPLVVWDDD